LVASVEKGAPAEKGGVEVGDVILKFEGKPVAQSSDLPRMVGATKPGTRVTVQVWRKGNTRDLNMAVGEMPDDKGTTQAKRAGKGSDATAANRLGLVLSELSAEQRKQAGVTHGLVVEDVVNGGARTDLRPGDVILSLINKGVQTDLKTVEQFSGMLAKFDKSSIFTLLVLRGDTQTFITIRGFADK
jgi:serine protease Do